MARNLICNNAYNTKENSFSIISCKLTNKKCVCSKFENEEIGYVIQALLINQCPGSNCKKDICEMYNVIKKVYFEYKLDENINNIIDKYDIEIDSDGNIKE